jgi:hypothetical protein
MIVLSEMEDQRVGVCLTSELREAGNGRIVAAVTERDAL